MSFAKYASTVYPKAFIIYFAHSLGGYFSSCRVIHHTRYKDINRKGAFSNGNFGPSLAPVGGNQPRNLSTVWFIRSHSAVWTHPQHTQCLVVFQRVCVKIVLYLLLFSVIIPSLNVKMTCCAVFGCSNDSKQGKDHTYHKFPSDKTLKSKWSSAMKRKGFMPTQHSRVCSAHFQSDDYETLEYHASHLKYSWFGG